MRAFYLILFVLFPLLSSAGTDTTGTGWHVVIQPQFGFIIPHRSEMQHLIKGHSCGANLQFLKQTSGKKPWHQAYGLPLHGVDVFFNDTGNRDQLGQQLALSYMVKLALRRQKKTTGKKNPFFHHLGLGVGVGYQTRTWDLESNYQAQVIGSPLNAALTLEYSVRIVRFKQLGIYAGLRMTHFSNGAFTLPNLGTNNVALQTSFQWGERRIRVGNMIQPQKEVFGEWHVSVAGGLKEITPPNGRKYASIVLSGLYDRRVSVKSSFGTGPDLFFNNAVKALRNRFSEEPQGWEKCAQLGWVLSYGLHFDRMALRIQQGFYLVNTWQADGSYYQRVFLRYRVNDHLSLQIGLKTHFAKADHAELGLGYIFGKR